MLPVPFHGHRCDEAIFILTYAVWLVFEIVAGKSRKSTDPTKASDHGSFRFLLSMIWAGIALAWTVAFAFPQTAIPFMRNGIFVAGISLMWAGIGFRYYAMRVLGPYFTFQVDVRSEQTVIEAGPYRYIRHPSYTGALITVIGLGLALGNWVGIVVLLVFTGIGYAYRIHVEEAELVAALGEPYKNYMGRTQRLVPFVL